MYQRYLYLFHLSHAHAVSRDQPTPGHACFSFHQLLWQVLPSPSCTEHTQEPTSLTTDKENQTLLLVKRQVCDTS
jgi:hypothetical protein